MEIKGKIAHYLGMSERANIKSDTLKISKEIDMEGVLNFKCSAHLQKCNHVVVSFLKGVANIMEHEDMKDNPEKLAVYKLTKTVESIMNLSLANSVLPLNFR